MNKKEFSKNVREMFFKKKERRELAKENKYNHCVVCGLPVYKEDFIDGKSHEEYLISGLCQNCQDKIFMNKRNM